MEPPDGADHYTETLVRLPNLGLCYLPERAFRRCGWTAPRLGLAPEGPVYWSGQALYKYLPQYDAVFPRIAAAVGACQFVFIGFAKSQAVTAAFRERLGRGVRCVRGWTRISIAWCCRRCRPSNSSPRWGWRMWFWIRRAGRAANPRWIAWRLDPGHRHAARPVHARPPHRGDPAPDRLRRDDRQVAGRLRGDRGAAGT